MSDSTPHDRVLDSEQLARFVISTRWVRADGTVKQDAFIPPSDLNLSVTRHAELSVNDLWERGRSVAVQLAKPLRGRADVVTEAVRTFANLNAVGAPLPENPQHAHIVGWSNDKPAQKAAAQQLAASAQFVPAPTAPSN